MPLKNLHPVPDGISDEAASFAEPLAAALEILQQVHIHPVDRVLVVGAGRLGQLAAQVLALTGCDLAVVARHPWQRNLLAARHIRSLNEAEISQRQWDVVIDVAGTPEGFQLARQAVRPRGVIVLKSTFKGNLSLNMASIVVDEITLIGSRCGPFEPALQLLARGEVDPLPLVAARYPLAEGVAALQHAAQPGILKVLLEM